MSDARSLWPAAREAFRRLCDLPEALRRDELQRIGESQPELASYLQSLFRHDSGPDLAFVAAIDDMREDFEARHALNGDRAGPWNLECEIGRGGMGEVWRARRVEDGFEQVAALKLLKRGMDSEALIGRFLQERRILARLEHPNIARLLDGGVTASGRPYFAMELVEGVPVTEYVNAHGLSLRGVLRLFLRICSAVEFAHRNLVVHRDLKPSNILVGDDGNPRLLDFGIAKLLDDDDDSTVTQTRMRAMTPAYAAPEQISGGDVTTATDVFGLGLVLHQMVTGTLPPERRSQPPQGWASEPVEIGTRPSHSLRLADTGAPEALAARRLAREVAGDLDAIILTALRSDPTRRYPSAAALAQDIGRFLDGRPVLARPDAFGYRARRFVKRHRTGVALGVLALTALVGGLVTALWQARVASEALLRVEAEFARAEREFHRAEAARSFLVGLFDAGNPNAPHADAARTVRELLADAGDSLESTLAAEPEVQAELRTQVAISLRGFGDEARALELIERSIDQLRDLDGIAPYQLARAMQTKASILFDRGDAGEAEFWIREALALLPAAPPEDRERQLRRAMHTTLGRVLSGSGREAEAMRVYQRDLRDRIAEFGADHPNLATPWFNLAAMAIFAEDYAEALRALREVERLLAPDGGRASVRYLYLWSALAIALDGLGNSAEARAYFQRAAASKRAHFPDHRVSTVFIRRLEAQLALSEQRPRDAVEPARSAWQEATETERPSMAKTLIEALLALGAFEEASAVAYEGYRAAIDVRGVDHPFAIHLHAARTFANCLPDCDATDIAHLESAAQRLRVSGHRRSYAQVLAWLALLHRDLQPERSDALETTARDILTQVLGPQHGAVRSLAGARMIESHLRKP